jgi:hypothetical protein
MFKLDGDSGSRYLCNEAPANIFFAVRPVRPSLILACAKVAEVGGGGAGTSGRPNLKQALGVGFWP